MGGIKRKAKERCSSHHAFIPLLANERGQRRSSHRQISPCSPFRLRHAIRRDASRGGSHGPVNVAFKGFGVWVRLVRCLPRPNISFKRDTPWRGIFGCRVSSALRRCSGFIVGVPLNSYVRQSEKSQLLFSAWVTSIKLEQEHLKALASLLADVRGASRTYSAHNERDRPTGKRSDYEQTSLRPQ